MDSTASSPPTSSTSSPSSASPPPPLPPVSSTSTAACAIVSHLDLNNMLHQKHRYHYHHNTNNSHIRTTSTTMAATLPHNNDNNADKLPPSLRLLPLFLVFSLLVCIANLLSPTTLFPLQQQHQHRHIVTPASTPSKSTPAVLSQQQRSREQSSGPVSVSSVVTDASDKHPQQQEQQHAEISYSNDETKNVAQQQEQQRDDSQQVQHDGESDNDDVDLDTDVPMSGAVDDDEDDDFVKVDVNNDVDVEDENNNGDRDINIIDDDNDDNDVKNKNKNSNDMSKPLQQSVNHDSSPATMTSSVSTSTPTTSSTRKPSLPSTPYCILVKPAGSQVDLVPAFLSLNHSVDSTSSDPTDKELQYHFNTRSFCLLSDFCLSRRTSSSIGVVYERHRSLQQQKQQGTSKKSLVADDAEKPLCRRAPPLLVDDDTSPENRATNCDDLYDTVHCAFSRQPKQPFSCPPRRPLSDLLENDVDNDGEERRRRATSRNRIESDLTLIVPAYLNLYNIYHYAYIIGLINQIMSALNGLLLTWPVPTTTSTTASSSSDTDALRQVLHRPAKRVTLLFRGDVPSGYGGWQRELTQALITHRFSALGFTVDVQSLYEDEFQPWFRYSSSLNSPSFLRVRAAATAQERQGDGGPVTCVEGRALLLGYRMTSAWPFASHTTFERIDITKHTDVSSVPFDAVVFKAAVYRSLSLPSVTSSSPSSSSALQTLLASSVTSMPQTLLLDLPPLKIGYARRNVDTKPDPPPGQFIRGRARRFSDADEAWFISMLQSVASQHGLLYATLQPREDTPFAQQVRAFKQIGVLVGIHGANLVNAIFMHSFTALVELANDNTVCYIRGGNAGLRYWHFTPSHIASVQESFCGPKNSKCLAHPRNRRIFLEREMDRVAVRDVVEQAVKSIIDIRQRFKHVGGVPVRFNRQRSEYEIDWGAGGAGEDTD